MLRQSRAPSLGLLQMRGSEVYIQGNAFHSSARERVADEGITQPVSQPHRLCLQARVLRPPGAHGGGGGWGIRVFVHRGP